jgi:hypothetical protein
MAAAGMAPKQLSTLEVRGRRSGDLISFPVVVADYGRERYLVAMLGEGGGEVRLEEVDPDVRAPILRRYLELAPGARAHFPVGPEASLEEFGEIASQHPVFRVRSGSARENNTPAGQPS